VACFKPRLLVASGDEPSCSAVRIWALLGARAGDNDQVIALAEALGLPFELKQLKYNSLNRVGPLLLGRSVASLTAFSRAAILAEPPPHLTISTGHRSVPVVRALRHRSAGRTRSIHVGFPRVSPGEFDLVIATPQYPMADHPRLLRIPYALTKAAVSKPLPADSADIVQLKRPRRLLLVGGPTLFWDFDERVLKATLSEMLDAATEDGGSVLVSTSSRTPDRLSTEIKAMLDSSPAPTVFARPGTPPDYASLLASADSIHVTADSVSMVSDAIWTGKPVAVVPIRKSASGKLVFGLMDGIRPGVRVYPQDLRFFWRALAELGVSDRLAIPRTSTADVMHAVLERTKTVIDPIVSAASACS
jgi:mitochondrial fission protein ELM1